MAQSRRIFLICTQELTAAHLARGKMRHLRVAGLDDRVILVVNRWHKSGALSLADLEKRLELPADYVIPEAPKDLHAAAPKGGEVPAASALGRELANWRKDLGDVPVSAPRLERKRLAKYLSIAPARHVIHSAGN